MEFDLDNIPTYSDMFRQYLGQATWLTAAELPLVHHIASLCKQLDSAGLDKASLASAYLQAIERLNKRRPGAPGGGRVDGDLPGQTSIFDELPD